MRHRFSTSIRMKKSARSTTSGPHRWSERPIPRRNPSPMCFNSRSVATLRSKGSTRWRSGIHTISASWTIPGTSTASIDELGPETKKKRSTGSAFFWPKRSLWPLPQRLLILIPRWVGLRLLLIRVLRGCRRGCIRGNCVAINQDLHAAVLRAPLRTFVVGDRCGLAVGNGHDLQRIELFLGDEIPAHRIRPTLPELIVVIIGAGVIGVTRNEENRRI